MSGADFDRVAALLVELRDMAPEQRAARLEALGDEDTALRAEVESMMEHCEQPTGFLDQPAWEGGSVAALVGALGEVDEPATPDAVGRYRIIEPIGSGGMGTVYRAEQDTPRREVALKLIRRHAMSRESLRRFRQEVEILGRLAHPGIARIYDAGTIDIGEGGQPYFAMDLITGPSLTKHANDNQLGTHQRLELVARICDAVEHAHQKGVIHRDLKPDNILVEKDGQPKVLDFGIARATDSDMQVTTMQTDIGQLIGTVQYMSPEQVAGDTRKIDVRSDVYALGVILFELLAGRPPYDLSHRSIPDAIQVIREQTPSRLSTVDASFRGDIETIIGKALEKEPDRRYPSAAALAIDIRHLLLNEPITARPPSTWYQVRKFTQRNRAVVAGVVATLFVLVAGVVVAGALAIQSMVNAAEARRESYRAGITAASAVLLDDPGTAGRYLDATPPALRGWEWRHLKSRIDPHVMSYRAAASPGSSLAVTADGAHVLSTLTDGTVAIWTRHDGQLVRTLREDAPITMLALPAAGPARLALGTADDRVILCDLDGGGREVLQPVDGGVLHVAWDGAGVSVAVITGRSLLLGQPGGDLRELHRGAIRATLAFSPDGARLATLLVVGQGSSALAIWDTTTGERLVTPGLAEHYPTAIAWSRDGSKLIVGTQFRLVAEISAQTYEVTRWLAGHRDNVGVIVESPTGELASSGEDGTIRLWRDGASVGVLEVGHPTPVAFTASGTGLAYNAGHEIHLWDLTAGAATVLRRHTSYVYHVDFSPDGSLLASGAYPGPEAMVWDADSADRVAALDAPRGVSFMGFTADGLLRINHELFDPATGAHRGVAEPTLTQLINGEARTTAWRRIAPNYACSDDGTLIVTGSRYITAPGPIRVHDTTGATRLELDGDYWGADFSPDTKHIAVAAKSGMVEIHDLATGERIAELSEHAEYGDAYCVAFHPDGTRLASGGNDGTIRLWDTTTWYQVHEMRGHTSYVKSLAFSPDGTQLASGSGDFTVRIWDTIPRAERARSGR